MRRFQRLDLSDEWVNFGRFSSFGKERQVDESSRCHEKLVLCLLNDFWIKNSVGIVELSVLQRMGGMSPAT